jgi:hypothetical protein
MCPASVVLRTSALTPEPAVLLRKTMRLSVLTRTVFSSRLACVQSAAWPHAGSGSSARPSGRPGRDRSRQHPTALDRMAAASGLMTSIGIDVRGLSEGLIHMSERQVQFRHHIVRRFAESPATLPQHNRRRPPNARTRSRPRRAHLPPAADSRRWTAIGSPT